MQDFFHQQYFGASNSLRRVWWFLFQAKDPRKKTVALLTFGECIWTPKCWVYPIWEGGAFCISSDWPVLKNGFGAFCFLRVSFSSVISMSSCAIPSYDQFPGIYLVATAPGEANNYVACSRLIFLLKEVDDLIELLTFFHSGSILDCFGSAAMGERWKEVVPLDFKI